MHDCGRNVTKPMTAEEIILVSETKTCSERLPLTMSERRPKKEQKEEPHLTHDRADKQTDKYHNSRHLKRLKTKTKSISECYLLQNWWPPPCSLPAQPSPSPRSWKENCSFLWISPLEVSIWVQIMLICPCYCPNPTHCSSFHFVAENID